MANIFVSHFTWLLSIRSPKTVVPIPFVLLLSLLLRLVYILLLEKIIIKIVFIKIFKSFVQVSKYSMHTILIVVCLQI